MVGSQKRRGFQMDVGSLLHSFVVPGVCSVSTLSSTIIIVGLFEEVRNW
jgi:hypothetical protein